jgi:hypothetical protein
LRYVHHLRIRRLNYIDGLARILLHLDHLLWGATQSAGCVGLSSQPLNRCGHLILIRRHCRPDCSVVVNIVRHHLQNTGKADKGNKCRVEALLLGSGGQLREGKVIVLRQPVVHIQNLLRIRGGGSDLGEKGIGVESDGSQQLIQLLRRGWRRSLGLKIGSKTLKEEKANQQKDCGHARFALHLDMIAAGLCIWV